LCWPVKIPGSGTKQTTWYFYQADHWPQASVVAADALPLLQQKPLPLLSCLVAAAAADLHV
jgi:hypothetical protein